MVVLSIQRLPGWLNLYSVVRYIYSVFATGEYSDCKKSSQMDVRKSIYLESSLWFILRQFRLFLTRLGRDGFSSGNKISRWGDKHRHEDEDLEVK
jgi:hypothetical protein